jgi:peptide/nickel transport system substrate-binding protein
VKTAAELFERRSDTWTNPQKPTLNAWLITTPYGQGTRMVAERNPYYFKVDTAGNQLPYIDRVVFDIVQDDQVLLLKVLAGEIDMHAEHVMTVENRAVLEEGKERGNYRFVDLLPSEASSAAYMLNLTHKNPVLREVFNNKKFRMALSYSIDREAVNDQVFVGQGIIMQPGIRPDYPLLYNEQLAKQYTEYNVDLANKLLDEAGYAKKDDRGMRLGPDGKPISFGLLTRNDKKFMVDISELLVHYFREVGIDARLDVAERSLVRQRAFSGQFDVNVEDLPGGKFDAFLRPQQLLPMHHNAVYGVEWYQWFLGKGGEEPPAPVKRQFDLWRQVNATTDQPKRVEMMKEIIQIAADNFFLIGICAPNLQYGIVSRRLRNVPDQMEGSYWFAPPGPTNPPTWYFTDAKG